MNTMLALPLVALMIGAGQVTSKDCCVADQFSAGFALPWVQISNVEGASFSQRVKGDVKMDYTGQRYAFNVTWHDYNQKISGTERDIFLFKEETMYTILNDSECYKQSYLGQEPIQCLPDEAEFDGSVSVGEKSLQLDSWKMSIDEQGGLQGDLRLATTQQNCIPVAASLIATYPGQYDRYVIDGISFNYTRGVGPSPFAIPDICRNATQKIKDGRKNVFKKWNLLLKGMVFF